MSQRQIVTRSVASQNPQQIAQENTTVTSSTGGRKRARPEDAHNNDVPPPKDRRVETHPTPVQTQNDSVCHWASLPFEVSARIFSFLQSDPSTQWHPYSMRLLCTAFAHPYFHEILKINLNIFNVLNLIKVRPEFFDVTQMQSHYDEFNKNKANHIATFIQTYKRALTPSEQELFHIVWYREQYERLLTTFLVNEFEKLKAFNPSLRISKINELIGQVIKSTANHICVKNDKRQREAIAVSGFIDLWEHLLLSKLGHYLEVIMFYLYNYITINDLNAIALPTSPTQNAANNELQCLSTTIGQHPSSGIHNADWEKNNVQTSMQFMQNCIYSGHEFKHLYITETFLRLSYYLHKEKMVPFLKKIDQIRIAFNIDLNAVKKPAKWIKDTSTNAIIETIASGENFKLVECWAGMDYKSTGIDGLSTLKINKKIQISTCVFIEQLNCIIGGESLIEFPNGIQKANEVISSGQGISILLNQYIKNLNPNNTNTYLVLNLIPRTIHTLNINNYDYYSSLQLFQYSLEELTILSQKSSSEIYNHITNDIISGMRHLKQKFTDLKTIYIKNITLIHNYRISPDMSVETIKKIEKVTEIMKRFKQYDYKYSKEKASILIKNTIKLNDITIEF